MNYRRKSKLTVCTMGVLTALLFCGFTSTGAYIPEPYQSAIHLPDGKMPSFASYAKDNAARIGGKSISGNWAASDTVTAALIWSRWITKSPISNSFINQNRNCLLLKTA